MARPHGNRLLAEDQLTGLNVTCGNHVPEGKEEKKRQGYRVNDNNGSTYVRSRACVHVNRERERSREEEVVAAKIKEEPEHVREELEEEEEEENNAKRTSRGRERIGARPVR